MANRFSDIAHIIEDALRRSGLEGNFTIRFDKSRKQLATNAALTARASSRGFPGNMSASCDPCAAGTPCSVPATSKNSANTPMETAKRLASLIADSPLVSEANIAPPGFINIKLSNLGILACLENLRRECAVLIKSYRRKGVGIWSGRTLLPCQYPSACGKKYIIVQAIRKSRSLIRIAHQEKLARFSVKHLQALDDCEQCAGRGEQAHENGEQCAGRGEHAPAGITSPHAAQTYKTCEQIPQDLGLSAEEINILLETADLLPCLSQKKSLGRALELGQLFCHYYNNCSILKGSAKLISLRLLISEAAGAVLALSLPIEKQEAKACKGK